ncbi:DNA polymerase IV [Leptolyngbya sp. AN03gr2]|uniref:DNA polymerase IV n=1 Tax=unclassified Leptolyngbya TaxID=2650499 RepID=UPI003D31934A
MGELRKIIHVDMDAFFAAVEQRDNPAYRGKPIVVGGSPDKRGAVAAASYEARKFGIHSAMPARTALHRCPHVVFVSPRFDVYRQVSQQIRAIFHRYTDLVEPLALDEAYLDVTENKLGIPSATWIANEIRQQIYQEIGLTASAGISINKFLAKMASGMNKPNGSYLIAPNDAIAFVEQLPIEKFHGIGQVTAAKMHQLGIKTGAELKQWSETDLVQQFGKIGRFYFRIARAEDDRPVQPNRVLKSVGAETTFEKDLDEIEAMRQALELIAQTVGNRLRSKRTSGRTVTLKVKFASYEQITRSRTELMPITATERILELAQALLPIAELHDRKVRLLGISISNLGESKDNGVFQQLALPFAVEAKL